MVKLIHTLILILIVFTSQSIFAQKLGFTKVLDESPELITTFCIPNNETNNSLIINQGVTAKYSTSEWIFVSATPSWINEMMGERKLTDFYFELAPPVLLTDSSRGTHFVDEIHAGTGGLNSSYTGKGIIIGIVDEGLDWAHPDFQDSLGNTRVINYWDQTMGDNGNSPSPYGYGQVWDSTDINNGTCTSTDNAAHGTTVAGQATGNGLANGSNKGMAPDATIIIVETNFNRPNWTLTVADACDYIFNIAESKNMPAVVNLSLGSYYGSHDGNDPASIAIEAMLDAKPGRIVVSACGNSGNQGKYHQQGNPMVDTNFVWLESNSGGAFAGNTIFFDLWSDVADANFNFAFGANATGPNWSDRGRTNFYNAIGTAGAAIFDTIWNGANRIGTFGIYSAIENGRYHMQILAYIDSTNYKFRFETTGSGRYDLWSGTFAGYNNMTVNAPPIAEFPDAIYYVNPDSLQSIVSSWNCSEKVVSVGNIRNRYSFINLDLNEYISPNPTLVKQLSLNSSKGPSRHDLIKPDITATGDITVSSAPIPWLTAPANSAFIDSGGWHALNGGSSIAAPVVAGIAALYLERCSKATYQDFIDDIHSTAFTDLFTGVVPNNSYGYGKIHGLNTLLEQVIPAPANITFSWTASLLTSSELTGNEWYLDGVLLSGETNQDLTVTPPFGTYEVIYTNNDGCSSKSDPIQLNVGIEEIDKSLISTSPNPSNSSIKINYEENINGVNVYNSNGEKVLIEQISEKVYSIENLSKGVYILNIITDKGIYSSKIIRN